MDSIINRADAAHHRPSVATIKDALRDARVQLSVLNHQVGSRADVRDADFDCLDLISIHSPVSPSALSKLAGLHPATVTGILDRLAQGGWIARDRDAADRRAVVIRVLPDRDAEVYELYSGMNSLIDDICADYDDRQLDAISGFLQRVREAAAAATEELSTAP
jgi:DNA-binding MarR family transcriptional regulator